MAEPSLDLEDSLIFRRRLRELQLTVQASRDAECKARLALSAARKARLDAELRLRNFLEEDLAGLPLFDRAQSPPDYDDAYYAEKPQLHDIDADREHETAQAEAVETAEARPSPIPAESLDPGEPGSRLIAELTVGGFPARLWMRAIGDYEVYFDCQNFGNWHSETIAHDDLRPDEDAIAVAASDASGLPFRANDSEPCSDNRVWRTRLDLDDEHHPEPWRLAELVAHVVGNTPVAYKVRTDTRAWFLGELDGWFAERPDRKLSQLKGVKPAMEKEFLSAIRVWWHKHHPSRPWPEWLGPWQPPVEKDQSETIHGESNARK